MAEPDPPARAEEGEPTHDPTGIDLARQVAAQFRGRGDATRSRGAATPCRRAPTSDYSGAHPDERDPAPLSSTVERLVTDSGWSTDVSVHTVLGRWEHIVGPEVARHCTPTSYDAGVVAVTADSTAWATQLRLLAANVVARLNAELGEGTVVRVEVSGPSAPSWRHGRRSAGGRGPRDTYG